MSECEKYIVEEIRLLKNIEILLRALVLVFNRELPKDLT